MINERKNSEDSILSCNGIEILSQKDKQRKQRKKRKRDENYEKIAKSPQIQYWLNIINENKTLVQ